MILGGSGGGGGQKPDAGAAVLDIVATTFVVRERVTCGDKRVAHARKFPVAGRIIEQHGSDSSADRATVAHREARALASAGSDVRLEPRGGQGGDNGGECGAGGGVHSVFIGHARVGVKLFFAILCYVYVTRQPTVETSARRIPVRRVYGPARLAGLCLVLVARGLRTDQRK